MKRLIGFALCLGLLGAGSAWAEDALGLVRNTRGMVKIQVYGYVPSSGLQSEDRDTRVETACYADQVSGETVKELYASSAMKITHEFEYDPKIHDRGELKFWLNGVSRVNGLPVKLSGSASTPIPTTPGIYEFAVPLTRGDAEPDAIQPVSEDNPSPVGLVR